MSFEGYHQKLCRKGHYFTEDAETTLYVGETEKCPTCGEKFVWNNLVDVTNGSYEGSIRIDKYIALEIDKETKCKECGHTLEITYKIPKTKDKLNKNLCSKHQRVHRGEGYPSCKFPNKKEK